MLITDETPIRLHLTINNRSLNEKQHRALDRIMKKDPNALVTGWDEGEHGPIVTFSNMATKVVRTTGYTTAYN